MAMTGLTGLQPLAAIEAAAALPPAPDARAESLARLTQIAIGKETTATILGRLPDGQFLARIANVAVRMPLPAGTRAGDEIRLILVSAQPRPTFLLASDRDGGSATASFSDAGRLINHMLRLAQGMPARISNSVALLPAPAAGAAPPAVEIAEALHDTLATSGLFYESHVAEWANGLRPLETLMREPQARFGAAAQLTTNPVTAWPPPDSVAQPETIASGSMPGRSQEAAIAHDAPGDSAAASAVQADTLPAPAPQNNPEAAWLVSLQLDLLEQRRAAWQGELWPGQPLQWEISDEARQNHAGACDPGAARVWQSHVRVELPNLGAVSASLQLQGDRIRIQVRAGEAATASLLRTDSRMLADALDAAGSTLESLTVKQDEHA